MCRYYFLERFLVSITITVNLGSGRGAVGRVLVSDTRDLQFEASQWQNNLLQTVIRAVLKSLKYRNNRPGMAQF